MAAELAIIAKLQDEASSGIRSLRGEVEGLGDSGGIAAKGFESLQTVGTAALAALATAAAAVGGAIVSSIGVASEFEDSVTILSIAARGAGESFDSMRAAAMAVGADTSLVGVNASGAAEAMTTLYKAGMTTGEIFGDLNGYLAGNVELSGALRAAIDGAAASELSMEQAAMLAATSLATFGGEMVTTEERAAFVNTAMNNFVQAADASMASVADLAAAMQTIGPTAAQFGFSLQDTNTALAILSTRGIAGSEAGTALKSMFNNLMQTTPQTTAALNELGVSLYNADGTMRSMPQIIGDLSQALYGMNEVTTITGGRTAEQNHQLELAQKSYDQATDAIYKHTAGLKTLTDSQLQKYRDQQAAANIEIERLSSITGTATTAVSQLTEEQRNQYIATLAGSYGMKAMAVLLMEGTDGWTAMEKAIASAATIQEVAAARTATFSGAMEALSGVVETIRIGIGSAFLPVLTALARVFADMAAEALPYIVGAFEALGGALTAFFDAILAGTHPVTAFADAVGQLAEALGMPAEQAALLKSQIEGVLMAIGSVVGPIVQAITSFVSWKDVLAAVGIAIASVVIPALIGLVQVFAPIIATIAAVILAVAALRNAWESDFLGIRSAVEGAVEIFGRFVEAIRVLTDENARIQAMVDALAKLPEPLQLLAAAVASFINTLRDGGSLVDAFRAGLETLKQAIFDWAGTTNWGEIGGIILDKIAAAFSSLGDRVATTAAGILNWITTSVNSIDWNAVGTAIVNGIAAAITGVVGLLVAGGTAIVNFFSGFFTNDSLQTAGTSLVTALGNAISGAAAGIASGLESIKQAIFDWAGADSWGEVGSAIIDKIAETFRNLGDKVAEVEAGIFNWISEAINGIDWREVGESIINGIVAAITAVVGLLVSAGTAIVNYFVGFFTNDEIAPAAQNLITSLGNAIGEFAGGIVDGLAKVRDAIFNWAGVEDWSGVANKIVEMIGLKLGEAKDAIAAKLGEWQTAIFDWAGTEDWQGVADHIADLIGEKLGEAKDAIDDQLGEWQQAIFDWADAEDWLGVAEHIAEMIGEKLGEAKDAISSKLSDWRQAILDWADAEDWPGVANHIAELLGVALGEADEQVVAEMDSWYASFVTWAEETDWTGVAATIASALGMGLVGEAMTVTDDLDSWVTAIDGWAGDTDWSGVSTTMAEQIGDGLADQVEAVTEKMSGWIGEFTAWVERTDFKQVGFDIMYKITDAFLDFKTAVTTKVATWLADLKAITETYTWQEIGGYILLKIVEAISGKGGGEGGGEAGVSWDAAVGNWIYEIGQAITRIQASLQQLGKDIVAGIAAGITAATDFIRGAIEGVIAAALGAGENAAGAHSPARAFMPLGSDITAGVAVGIEQNVGAVTAAIQRVAAAIELEGVKAFGEAMKAIAEGVAAAMSAILDIGSFQGAGEGFGAALQTIVDLMSLMVSSIAAANTYSVEVLEQLGAFVEVAGDIGDLLTQAADVVDYIARWRPPDIAATNGAIQLLADFLSVMVQGVLSLGMEAMLLLGALGEFVDTAAELPELFMGVADIASYLAGWQAPSLEPVIANVQQLASLLGVLVTAVAGANTMGLGMLDILATFTETALGVVALIAPLADAMLDIANFPPGAEFSIMQRNIETMAGYLGQIVTAVAGANTMGLLSLEQLGAFVEVAAGIVDLIDPMAQAMLDIANFPPGADVQVMAHNIETMAGYLHQLVAAIAESNTWGQLSLELLDTFVQVAGSIAELITPLAEAIWNIANFQSPDLFAFVGNVATLAGHLATMVVWFYNGLNLSQAALEALGQYVEVMGSIAEGVVAFIDAIAAIAAFEPPDLFTFVGNVATLAGHLATMVVWFYNGLNLSQAALEALGQYIEVMSSIAEGMVSFIDAIAAIVGFQPPDLFVFVGNMATLAGHLSTMVVWFYNGLNLSMAALEALGQYVEVIGDLVDLIADAIEALGLIAAYSGNTAVLGPAIAAFAGDLLLLVQTLATTLASASAASLAAILAAGELADGLSDILGMVEDGVDALTALASYVSAANLASTAQQFAADLATAINTIVAGLQQAGVLASASIVAAADLADGLGDVLGMVEDGVDALTALATYVPNANIIPLAQQFAADLSVALIAVADGLREAGVLADSAIVAAGELADALGDVLGVVEDGVGALSALAGYIPAADLAATTQRFAADLALVINTIVAALQEAGVLANAAITAAGEMATALEDIVGVVKPAVEAVVFLVGYVQVGGLQQAVQQFAADLVIVVTTLADGFREAGLATNQAVLEAAELSSTLDDLLKVVKPALHGTDGAITLISHYVRDANLQAKVEQFTADLIMVAQTLVDGLTQSTLAIGVALAKAGEMGKALKDLFDGIKPAMDVIGDVADYTAAANLEQKVQQFAADLVALVTAIVTALSAAADQLGAAAVEKALELAEAAASLGNYAGGAMDALNEIATMPVLDGIVAKMTAFGQVLTAATTALVASLSAAATAIGQEAMAAASKFAADAVTLLNEVGAALAALVAIGEHELANGLSAKIQIFAQELINVTTYLALGLGSAAAQLGGQVIADAVQFAADAAAILSAVSEALTALVAIGEHQLTSGLSAKIQVFAQELINVTTYLALGLGSAAAQLGESVIADATAFAADAKTILDAVGVALTALVAIGEHQLTNGLSAKIQIFAQELINVTTYLALGLGSAAAQLGESVIADATAFAADAKTILDAVGVALTAMTAIGEHQLTSGLSAKIQAFAQELINVTTYLALGLGSAAAQLGEAVIAAALSFAAHATTIAQAVDTALQAIAAIAANEDVAGMGGRIQALGQELVNIATFLATSLAAAAQHVTADIVAAATQFATSVTALAVSVGDAVNALGQIGSIATPDVAPKLTYLVTSAQLIQQAFTAAGDIGAAVAYAEAFRANLQQLVAEIQQAVALLNQIAGTGTTGTIGAALAAIAASLQNTTGQFAGAGTVLAQALIAALAAGINAGSGSVQGAATYMLEATRAAGETAANRFTSVGDAITDAVSSAVLSGQGQVIAAVTQVINAAIAAGVAAARAAASIGQQLIQAALTEVNNGRGALDTAGGAAGNALIDGMARAITNGKSRVVNAIIATVNAAISAAKAALGIASPSKVAIDLLSNFMNTAARTVEGLRGRLADSMATAVSGAAQAAATGLNGVRLTPATVPGFGAPAVSDSLGERAAFAAAGRGRVAEASGANHTQVVFYGNVVLPNVVDSRSFLEELDALRGGA